LVNSKELLIGTSDAADEVSHKSMLLQLSTMSVRISRSYRYHFIPQ